MTTCQGGAQDADLFQGHDLVGPAQPAPAMLHREAEAEQAAPGRLGHVLTGIADAVVVHVEDELPGHPLDKAAHLIAEVLLGGRQHRVEHRRSSFEPYRGLQEFHAPAASRRDAIDVFYNHSNMPKAAVKIGLHLAFGTEAPMLARTHLLHRGSINPEKEKGMKIYVICDLEGTAGVVDHRRQCWFDGADYAQARRLATLELNALVEGALEGGATDILAWDGHGNFPGGLDPELVHPACRLITGAGDGGSVAFDGSFDAMFLLGLHAMAGAERSVLAHSFWPGVVACWLNGVKIGEVGLSAFMFGRVGVPTVFISGDRAGAEEARALIPAIEVVVVKEGLETTRIGDRGVEPSPAITLAPERARQEIRAGARRAMARVGSVLPWSLEAPYTWRVQFRTEELAAQRAERPGVRRVDAFTLETVAAAAPDVIL